MPKKLNDASVRAMRARYRECASYREVAAEFGVSRTAAMNAILGRNWKHVPGAVSTEESTERRVGVLHWRSTLTEDRVREARAFVRAGGSLVDAADGDKNLYGTLIRAVQGRNWKHVPGAIGPEEWAAIAARRKQCRES